MKRALIWPLWAAGGIAVLAAMLGLGIVLALTAGPILVELAR